MTHSASIFQDLVRNITRQFTKEFLVVHAQLSPNSCNVDVVFEWPARDRLYRVTWSYWQVMAPHTLDDLVEKAVKSLTTRRTRAIPVKQSDKYIRIIRSMV